MSDGVRDIAFLHKSHHGDLGAGRVWQLFGVKPFEDPNGKEESKVIEA
jgi:hypothetical protein